MIRPFLGNFRPPQQPSGAFCAPVFRGDTALARLFAPDLKCHSAESRNSWARRRFGSPKACVRRRASERFVKMLKALEARSETLPETHQTALSALRPISRGSDCKAAPSSKAVRSGVKRTLMLRTAPCPRPKLARPAEMLCRLCDTLGTDSGLRAQAALGGCAPEQSADPFIGSSSQLHRAR